MGGRGTTARDITASWRLLRVVGLVSALVAPAAAAAQSAGCAAPRARIDAASRSSDDGALALEIRQTRAELERVRAYADESGCNAGSVFDDPASPACRALLQRAEALRQSLDRLAAENAPGGSDAGRRAAVDDDDPSCTEGGTDAALPTPDAVLPVDPDAPAAPAPAPVPADRVARVLCVRHCDGAFYPLAVDVATDKLAGLDQLCRAQCPGAESSAYTDREGDVAKAQGSDGTSYAALPAAFLFQKATSPTCACRAPGESWAQTLARAQTMIEARKGDVVVTPEIQARMALPQPAPEAKAAAAKPVSVKPAPKRAKYPPAKSPSEKSPPAADAGAPNAGEDLTRAFRRSDPTF